MSAPSRSATMITGRVALSVKPFAASRTCVDSALAGRNDAASFFCSWESCPTRTPPTEATPSHRMSNAMAPRRTRREGADGGNLSHGE